MTSESERSYKCRVDSWLEAADVPDWLFDLHNKLYASGLEMKTPEQWRLTLTPVWVMEEVQSGTSMERVKSRSRSKEYLPALKTACVIPEGVTISACRPPADSSSDKSRKKVQSVLVSNVIIGGQRLGQLRVFAGPKLPEPHRIKMTRYSSNGRRGISRNSAGLYVVL